MHWARRTYLFALAGAVLTRPAFADNELTLFDANGAATAYIAVDDELTIYLWSGKPVAYMDTHGNDAYAVYGFNGRHLGWFINGVIWQHDGNAACALKERLQVMAQLEPLKALKQLKPLRALKELAPLSPAFRNAFGGTACVFLLSSGSAY